MAGAKQRIVYSVEMDQGGGRWQVILHTEVFGHAQAIAEDARVGGAKVRVTEEAAPAASAAYRRPQSPACVDDALLSPSLALRKILG
ncbi:hypothetical protein ACN2CC_18225 [Mesorhizobium muleiense]|uniref:hypothetical protein n=1 Tax=Mesorhizobium TaxID=68287 RepID=UPI000FE85D6E|nr:hypothetical protein [Mesorhizobium sp.]RWP11815.1 MAG: hypothetical protein EOR00_27930 [Mesorhizobium sp.]